MKKIVPLLIVGILVLSGIGAVAIESEKSEGINSARPFDFNAVARGGFGITIMIKNNNLVPIEKTGIAVIQLNGPIINNHQCVLKIPEPIPSRRRVWIRTGINNIMLGFGLFEIMIFLYVDDDGYIDGGASKNGFIIGPFVLMGRMKIQ